MAVGNEANPVVIVSPEKSGKKIVNEDVTAKTMVPKLSGFLLEPYFDEEKIISKQSIDKLQDGFWVSTEFIDYLIKFGIPFPAVTDEEVIVPMSAIHNLLTVYLRNAENDKEWYDKKKIDYQRYSIKPSTIIMISCDDSHFLVIKIEFDPTNTSGNIFKRTTIYDSLKRSGRNQKKLVSASSTEGMFLMRVQSFLAKYVLYGTSMGKKLINKPQFILKLAKIHECPIQKNLDDCGLFAIGVVYHLLNNVEIDATTFSQADITNFRQSLYSLFQIPEGEIKPDPKKFLSRAFIYSFFPKLKFTPFKPDPYLNYFLEQEKALATMQPLVTSLKTEKSEKNEEKFEELIGSGSEDEQEEEEEEEEEEENEEEAKEEGEVQVGMEEVQEGSNNNNITRDDKFKAIFVDNPDLALDILEQLDYIINEYQQWSGNSLSTKKVVKARLFRRYNCVQHKNCTFRASFGIRKSDCKIVLKRYNLQHCGMSRGLLTKANRKQKQRRKGMYKESIRTVEMVKSGEPNPKDIIKAAMNIQNEVPTYNQAYRACKEYKEEDLETEELYQLLLPYLEEFKDRNPGSGVFYEKDDEGRIDHLFVCPGVLSNKLRFVRPVISVDACHLNSEAKGTLYIATVKSANNELVPFGFTISSTNENKSGWNFFLDHLKNTCPLITVSHRLRRCTGYNNFSFISDRDKGLIEGMKQVFPNNHHMYCMEHIQRNVAVNCGPLAAKCIKPMGQTYNLQEEKKWWDELKKHSPKAVNYIRNIDPECWRNTSWLKNKKLPPRYGVKNTNMSEATNAMLFLHGKVHGWILCT